jgi:hypothetical protein
MICDMCGQNKKSTERRPPYDEDLCKPCYQDDLCVLRLKASLEGWTPSDDSTILSRKEKPT